MSKFNVTFSSLTINKVLDEEKYAQLQFSSRAGYPRLVVFTDKDRQRSEKPFDRNSMVVAPFDYTSMASLFDMADLVIAGDNGKARQIGCYNTKWVNGERTNEVTLVATVEIGKTEEGVIYMGVLAEGKKKVKFDLEPKDNSRWHKYYVNGELVADKGAKSKIFAKAYFDQARRLINHQMIIDTTNSKPLEARVPTLSTDTTPKVATKSVDTTSLDETDLF